MTRKERVIRAIEFKGPDRVPIWFFNRDRMRGDVLCFGLSAEQEGTSEWGYRWRRLDDGTMGQPAEPVLPTWQSLASYRFPELRPDQRMSGIKEFKLSSGGRYLLGSLGISGFTTYSFLRGFENSMIDFSRAAEHAGNLLDRILAFECELISLAAEHGLDGVHLADDWGTQHGLMIAPAMWREVFKPRYAAQFAHARRLGLHVWFHCCGRIDAVVPDFHEIGVDVMNTSQPNVVDTAGIGGLLRGQQCFMVPISYQTVSISGTPGQIEAEAQRLYRELGTPRGGFIGYVEEYSCMGMSQQNYEACARAFEALRPC